MGKWYSWGCIPYSPHQQCATSTPKTLSISPTKYRKCKPLDSSTMHYRSTLHEIYMRAWNKSPLDFIARPLPKCSLQYGWWCTKMSYSVPGGLPLVAHGHALIMTPLNYVLYWRNYQRKQLLLIACHVKISIKSAIATFCSHPMPMAHAVDVGLFQQEIAVEEEAATRISISPLSPMHVSCKVLHCNQFDLFVYICTV